MRSRFNQWILVFVTVAISFTAWATEDDEDKKLVKKTPVTTIENKIHGKTNKREKKDSFVVNIQVDDTLTFDEKKSIEDTLIFADDEVKMKAKPNGEKGKKEFAITNSEPIIKTLIYPNPSFGESVLEMETPDNTTTEIIITAQDGTIIRKENTNGKSYELKDLAAGTYLVTIKNGNQVVQKRLFVK